MTKRNRIDEDAAQAAFREEWRRLRGFAQALGEMSFANNGSAEEVADRQDRNLRAFEEMTARTGAAALTRFRELVPALEAALDQDADGSAEAATRALDAAAKAVSKARDAEIEAFLAELRRTKAEEDDDDEPVWEPFDG